MTPDAEPSHAAPGTPGNPISLTDPRMMRAFAHLLALSMSYGLTQREFRDFGLEDGVEDGNEDKERLSADKGLSRASA